MKAAVLGENGVEVREVPKGEFNFDLHALKRVDYIGVTFRTRSAEEVREINR